MTRRAAAVLAVALAVLAIPAVASAAGGGGGTVIVKYAPGVEGPERAALVDRTALVRTVQRLALVNARVERVVGSPAAVADRLEASPKVAYAEPNRLVRAQDLPRDPRFHDQWALRNRGQTGGKRGADIGALAGWRRARVGGYPRSGGVRVGVIDTGIDSSHPDLLGRVQACAQSRPITGGFREGYCNDETGHGTHVAGTIGAIADNRVGITGVAFNSPLLVCKALGGQSQSGRISDVVRCLGWLRQKGARVISMSFAGGPSRTLRRAAERAWRGGNAAGSVLVSAAGNGGGRKAAYPASYKQVISTTATNDRDGRPSFANIHRTVELAAPGVGIVSTTLGAGYKQLSGTSMAVPHVVGVAAQLRRMYPRARASRIRKKLGRTADDLGPRGRDKRFGYGRVNFARAAR